MTCPISLISGLRDLMSSRKPTRKMITDPISKPHNAGFVLRSSVRNDTKMPMANAPKIATPPYNAVGF